jgi:hypothetical protein
MEAFYCMGKRSRNWPESNWNFNRFGASIKHESVSNPPQLGSIRAVSSLNSAQSAFDPLPIDPVMV